MLKPMIEEPKDPKNTLIVDGLNLAFRWKHAGNVYDMPFGFEDTIKSLAKSYDCGKIVVLADGGSAWRKSIHPGYKMTRRLKHENDTPEEKEASQEFFGYYEKTLQKCKFPVIKLAGVEADDIAAFMVEHKYELDINSIWLISSDKDWDLLIEEDVSRFSTVTRKETTYDNWDYPVSIEDYVHFKTLMGDKGDDIPGVEGVGPKRAADLISEHGGIFDIIAKMPFKGKAKYIQALNEAKDQLLLSYQLIDIRSFWSDSIGDKIPELKQKLSEIYPHAVWKG
jgi:5'-3' exonuclease